MALQFAAVADDAIEHRLDVGAVVAEEHHQQAVRAAGAVERMTAAVGAGQIEARGLPAEVAEGGGEADHVGKNG
jgi:predicted phage gp36 major capsid-like protein